MKKLRGFTLIELLIVVAIIAILAAIAVPNFLEAQTRSKVSRVRSDHRSLATAIETYYIDCNEYPACTIQANETSDFTLYTTAPSEVGATFRVRATAAQTFNQLTTPIAYITSNFPDPFADTRGVGFLYYTDGKGWILGSFGPDVDQRTGGQMQWNNVSVNCGESTKQPPTGAGAGVETAYDSTKAQPSATILVGGNAGGAFTYDPTNGTVSPGDVWRVKQ